MSNTSSNPWTMMIHSHYTFPTYWAMMGSWWFNLITFFTISVNNQTHNHIIIWWKSIIIIHYTVDTSSSIISLNILLFFTHIYKGIIWIILYINHFNISCIDLKSFWIKTIVHIWNKALFYEVIFSQNMLDIFPCINISFDQVSCNSIFSKHLKFKLFRYISWICC